jgi:DnaK suppressor protein
MPCAGVNTAVKIDAADLEQREKLLLETRDNIIEQIRHLSAASLISPRQAGEELADVGSDDFLRDMELSQMGAEREKFLLIQDALERIKQGTYGLCLDCQRPIKRGRLDAIPYAKLCIRCKTNRELNGGNPPSEEADELVE